MITNDSDSLIMKDKETNETSDVQPNNTDKLSQFRKY